MPSSNTEVPLLFPVGGLSDDKARSKQDPLTSPDVLNVRAFEADEGREQGGTREGSVTIAGPVSGSSAVRQISVAQFDVRNSTFSQYNEDAQVEAWKVETPLRQDCVAVDIDAERNRYALDGRAGVAKYNADGELVWKFVLSVQDQLHVCRALVVDADGTFYVAVSSGGVQSTSRIWKFRPSGDGVGVPNEEWHIEPGMYCERLRLRDGVLYAAMNDARLARSSIRAYRLVQTAVPDLAWERTQVPYPTNGLDVRGADGAIATCHEANSTRSYDPRSPDTQKIAEDWTPRDLASWDARVWCELDAGDIDGDGSNNEAYTTGDAVTLWTDKSGNGRHAYSFTTLFASQPTNCTDPLVNRSPLFAGRDTVTFANPTVGILNAHSGLVSAANATTSTVFAGSQRTLIPAYTGAKALVLAVLRVSDVTNARVLLGQIGAGGVDRAIAVNADTTGGGLFATNAGKACYYQAASAGPYAAFDSTNGFCVVAFTIAASAAADGDQNVVNGTACTNATYTAGTGLALFNTQLGRFTTAITGATMVKGNPFDGELAYLLVLRDYSSGTLVSDAEFKQLVGWAHWRWGIAHKLDAGHTYLLQPPTKDALPGTSDSPYLYLTATQQMLVKWDPNKGRVRGVARDSATVGVGGIGYDCVFPRDGSLTAIYSMGPKGTAVGGTDTLKRTERSVVRRIKDGGDSLAVTGSGTWESLWGSFVSGNAALALEPTYNYPRMCVSGLVENATFGDVSGPAVYVPYYSTTAGDAAYQYLVTGTANAGTGTNSAPRRTFALSTGAGGYAVAVEANIPEYVPGTQSGIVDQYLSIGTPKEGTGSQETLWNLLLVRETKANAAPRSTFVSAFAGTALTHVSGASIVPIGGGQTLTGGNFLCVVDAFQRLWIVDSGTYVEVDPRVSDGTAKLWKSKTAGTLPKGARGLTYWRDRLVLWRGEDPTLLFMTGLGDPHDCDLAPIAPNGAQAVAFNVSGPVNCFVPLNMDVAMVGTQTQILQLTGDPAQGGRSDVIGDTQGLAFGEPWCKDPDGNTYVFGARGGVSMVVPGGLRSISDRTIRRRLEDIDLSLYFVRMVWNWRQNGLHVFLCPQVTASTPPPSFFWSRRRGTWWQDEFPFVVTSARLVDGDAVASRAVLVGCQDGMIRKFFESLDSDDGTPIRWRVVGGPIRSPSEQMAIFAKRPRFTIAAGLDVTVGLLASGDSNLPDIAQEWEMGEGLNDAAPVRARGSNVWWRLRGSGRMAYEGGSILVEEFGIRRAVI